ncbi:hypothetical protein PHLCEN_2v5337 [Hermanssonia centrifuga]|uniref:Uncharacterized protein n=1 Tax=Hermanssonia centrifuga TaxID=98765 RepID=A0A2R6P5I6_9APHY|nr:hypothetical protein PHLCEN_2v5337 [Hermanssonia centrifuga]
MLRKLTFYEAIHIQGQEYFAITPIPVKIENTAEPGACSSSNQLEAQPQDSSPPPENPWLHPDVLTNASAVQTSVSSSPSPLSPLTLIPSPSGTNIMLSSASSSATADSTQVPPAPLVSDVITITIGSVGIKFPLTIIPPGASETIVLQPPDLTIPGVITIGGPMTSGSPTDAAVTVMVTPTTSATVVTAVIASVATYTGTTTAPGGQSSVYTTM